MIRKIIGLTSQVVVTSLHVLGDVIEFWGTGVSRNELDMRGRRLAADLDDLRQENLQLQDENLRLANDVDALRFNGPTIYEDERQALMKCLLQQPLSEDDLEAIREMIRRVDPMPITSGEMTKRIEDALKTEIPWE